MSNSLFGILHPVVMQLLLRQYLPFEGFSYVWRSSHFHLGIFNFYLQCAHTTMQSPYPPMGIGGYLSKLVRNIWHVLSLGANNGIYCYKNTDPNNAAVCRATQQTMDLKPPTPTPKYKKRHFFDFSKRWLLIMSQVKIQTLCLYTSMTTLTFCVCARERKRKREGGGWWGGICLHFIFGCSFVLNLIRTAGTITQMWPH